MGEDDFLEAAYEDANGGDFDTATEYEEIEIECCECGEIFVDTLDASICPTCIVPYL